MCLKGGMIHFLKCNKSRKMAVIDIGCMQITPSQILQEIRKLDFTALDKFEEEAPEDLQECKGELFELYLKVNLKALDGRNIHKFEKIDLQLFTASHPHEDHVHLFPHLVRLCKRIDCIILSGDPAGYGQKVEFIEAIRNSVKDFQTKVYFTVLKSECSGIFLQDSHTVMQTLQKSKFDLNPNNIVKTSCWNNGRYESDDEKSLDLEFESYLDFDSFFLRFALMNHGFLKVSKKDHSLLYTQDVNNQSSIMFLEMKPNPDVKCTAKMKCLFTGDAEEDGLKLVLSDEDTYFPVVISPHVTSLHRSPSLISSIMELRPHAILLTTDSSNGTPSTETVDGILGTCVNVPKLAFSHEVSAYKKSNSVDPENKYVLNPVKTEKAVFSLDHTINLTFCLNTIYIREYCKKKQTRTNQE